MSDSATSNTPRKPQRNRPKLRDGVMKRGSTWSYVIRVTDPETGVSKPKWVGGFPTEDAAKEARDEARVKARRGEYIDRNAITVAEYLDEWLDAHAVEIKPKTLADYRHLIERHVKPNIGGLRLQAVRPGQITKLYRDLITTGGRHGTGLSPRTVSYVHAVLRKAFADAVLVEQVIPSNPVERAKRPRRRPAEPGDVWTAAQLRTFLKVAQTHRLFAFFHLAAYTGARRGELLNLRWRDVDLDNASVHIKGSAAFIAGKRIEGDDQERTDARGQHRCRNGRRSSGSPQAPARRQAEGRQVLEGRREGVGRLRLRNRLGRTCPPGHRLLPHDLPDQASQRAQGRYATG